MPDRDGFPIPDPRLMIMPIDGCLNTLDGRSVDTEFGTYTFLCKSCDNVHLMIQGTHMSVQLNMALTPEQADKLAMHLMSPQVAQET